MPSARCTYQHIHVWYLQQPRFERKRADRPTNRRTTITLRCARMRARGLMIHIYYCMKPPNIKAPKCTLFYFPGSKVTRARRYPCEHRSCSCITENLALGAWSRANKALSSASCFIGSRRCPRVIFPVMHSQGDLVYNNYWNK